MEDKHIDILRRRHVALVRDLEPKRLFAHLIQERVMTPNDQEGINNITTRRSRSEEFLRILPTRGPTAFQQFVKALEEHKPFLACTLLRDGRYILSHRFRCLTCQLSTAKKLFL